MRVTFVTIKTLPKVNNFPIGENSPNLVTLTPGPNPTTSIYNASIVKIYNASIVKIYNASIVKIYNASIVKIYNATSSLVRFKNKTSFFYFKKRSSLLQLWRCSCKFKIRRIGSRSHFYDRRIYNYNNNNNNNNNKTAISVHKPKLT
jgi:hypothetical protein